MASTRSVPKELAEHLMVPFASSERPLVTVFMDIFAPAHNGPWPPLLMFHGWHQDLMAPRERARMFARQGFCVVNLNLRGRCGTVGQPDANGWEIRDAVDALHHARQDFPQLCSATQPPRAWGASGGGGNVYALIGKCPDLVSAAVVWCGISDYAHWFEWNERGNYRDEMEQWIAPNPRDFPEAYASRGGLTVAGNRVCPLMVMHGDQDDCVPVHHARAYVKAQENFEDPPLLEYHELEGIGHQMGDVPYLAQAGDFLLAHAKPVYVTPRGRWTVAGYLKTHYFEVLWDRVDRVGAIDIDLRRRRVHLECASAAGAQLRIAGPVRQPEVIDPKPRGGRILAARQDRGWTILDLHLHGEPVGVRWKA